MKFKYKALIGFAGIAIFLISVQCAMQFIQSYKFVGFVKRDQSTWIGIAEVAQADKLSCLQELEQVKADKQACVKANNPDLFQDIK